MTIRLISKPNDAVEVCKLLLNHGMDFDQYWQWAEHRSGGREETLLALADYWSEMKAEMEQAGPKQTGGQSFG